MSTVMVLNTWTSKVKEITHTQSTYSKTSCRIQHLVYNLIWHKDKNSRHQLMLTHSSSTQEQNHFFYKWSNCLERVKMVKLMSGTAVFVSGFVPHKIMTCMYNLSLKKKEEEKGKTETRNEKRTDIDSQARDSYLSMWTFCGGQCLNNLGCNVIQHWIFLQSMKHKHLTEDFQLISLINKFSWERRKPISVPKVQLKWCLLKKNSFKDGILLNIKKRKEKKKI